MGFTVTREPRARGGAARTERREAPAAEGLGPRGAAAVVIVTLAVFAFSGAVPAIALAHAHGSDVVPVDLSSEVCQVPLESVMVLGAINAADENAVHVPPQSRLFAWQAPEAIDVIVSSDCGHGVKIDHVAGDAAAVSFPMSMSRALYVEVALPRGEQVSFRTTDAAGHHRVVRITD